MNLPYFFENNITTASTHFTLSEETSKHCIQVLRMREGEQLQLTDGKGLLNTATIIEANKKHCVVRMDHSRIQQPAERRISIAVSLLKNNTRFEWLLEKVTELGVQEIIPLICKRTEKQHFRFDRMQQILISAMLQSKQCWLPVLHEPIAFSNAVQESLYTQKIIAHCEDEQKHTLNSLAPYHQAQILIGPEGDFTPEEITLALQHQYIPVSLGNTRLRTETAGVTAAALLMHL